MKRVLLLGVFIMILGSFSLASAEPCDPSVVLLNQDPYPAVPGDYVKLVFQVDGLENPECVDFTFELLPDYPIEFDPDQDGIRFFGGVDFIKDFESNLLIPYDVRINEDALDGSNPIEVRFESSDVQTPEIFKTVELEIEDSRVDFEVYVKDYDYTTREITFEILNIEDSDIEALTIEVPKQQGVEIKGPNRVVVGDLDSNEYTTADFEATPQDGEILISLTYSDTINVRRTVEKKILFDSIYFTDRAGDPKPTPLSTQIIRVAIVLVLIGWFLRRRAQKKKAAKHKH